MKEKIDNFIVYIKTLLGDIIFLLSGILGVLAWILSLIVDEWELQISYLFIFIALLIAPYRAWQKLKNKNSALRKELKNLVENEVDYEFFYELYKVNLYSGKDEMKNEMEQLDSNINKISIGTTYWNELTSYKVDLSSYQNMQGNLYKLFLHVRNVGHSFDEKISITILPYESSHFLFEIIKPKKPDPPSRFQYFRNYEFPHLPIIHNSVADRYRVVHMAEQDIIKVTLREMSVESTATLMYEGFFIYSEKKTVTLLAEISSKETKKIIKKQIRINLADANKITLRQLRDDLDA